MGKPMLLSLLFTILVGCEAAVAQQSIPELSVLLTDATNSEPLLRIKNSATTAKMFCVRSSSLLADGRGYGNAIPHRCQSIGNFAIVLPRESLVVPAADVSMQHSAGNMVVTVAVVVFDLGGNITLSQEQRIRWEGSAQEASAAYRALVGR